MNLNEIQNALRTERVDGWLFFDHHRRDPLAYDILGISPTLLVSRRWYYFIPASGEPRGLVHRVEPHTLDALPGSKSQYSRWSEQTTLLSQLCGDARSVAMQFSPQCAVPYVSMVDAGTVDLIRSFGVNVVTSANLVQLFEARWTEVQLESHLEAGRRMDRLRAEAFDLIRTRLRDSVAIGEYEVHEFLRRRFSEQGLVTGHGPVVAVNANASDPHYEPTTTRSTLIGRGDLVLVDMWAKLDQSDAVYYDITWTGYCGPDPPARIRSVFDIVAAARDRGVQTVLTRAATGLQGFEVDDVVRSHIEASDLGSYFIHRTGHSIGTDVHGAGANMDNFETHDERRVIPRTCFSIEPGVYLPDFGIRSEVNVYVGEESSRVTGEIQDQLVILA